MFVSFLMNFAMNFGYKLADRRSRLARNAMSNSDRQFAVRRTPAATRNAELQNEGAAVLAPLGAFGSAPGPKAPRACLDRVALFPNLGVVLLGFSF